MEIKVTNIKKLNCRTFSNSIMESGLQNIGEITYRNACEYFIDNDLLVSKEDRDELESWLLDFGAWEDEEIKGWTDKEINGLLLQFIAGDINEYEAAKEQGELEEWEENEGGRLFKSGDDWYFDIN